ncbi:hypothetical protein AXX12_03145 [Anaerosporomusa subterranea]|uniref:Protein-L-IsoD(D-D) O-methyltransferase n=1 Tax=Anaerosporomusa subterranea TaxID=1794912 RepID=A0A154BUK2_ANASB|nr:hypothetical protein AXX12_03145 [Anaerosporomusa subterranea]
MRGKRKLVVTTVYEPTLSEIEQAKEIAVFLQLPYVKRGRRSLGNLRKLCQIDTLIVAADSGPKISTPDGELFFHIGMAALRIKNFRDGKPDHMAAAMELSQGVSVLDCTLGLGTDAIVASMLTGERGAVIGLEASELIAFITGWGLANLSAEANDITAAMRRIDVISADYRQYLPTLPDNYVDIVYFDPMFRRPVHRSSGIRPLREFADTGCLLEADLRQACRVAKRRVVVKETHGSPEFKRLGITTLVGGKYSSVQYGVIEQEGC